MQWGDENSWEEDDDEPALVACNSCGAEIYEDAQRCPVCENYVTDYESRRTGQPMWVTITAVLLLASFAYFALAPLLG